MFLRVLLFGSLGSLALHSLAQQAPPATAKPLRRDAIVEAIVVPSDDPRHAAFNPAVHEPRIILRNGGTDPLAGISIRYGTEGFLPRMFAWTGHLAAGASAEVQLPHLIDQRPGANTFTVSLGDPNGRKDQNKSNNTLTVPFTGAQVLPGELTVRLRTPVGNGGTLRLESTRGPVLLQWNWTAGTDTVLRETVFPANGSYVLTVADSGRAGAASVRVLDAAGQPLHALRSSARAGSRYQFLVDGTTAAPIVMPLVAEVHPRPGRGKALVEVYTAAAGEVVIRDWEEEPVDGWTVAAGMDVLQQVDIAAHKSGTYRVLFRQGADEREIGRIILP